MPTIALELCAKRIQVLYGSIINVQIWAISGQEEYKPIAI